MLILTEIRVFTLKVNIKTDVIVLTINKPNHISQSSPVPVVTAVIVLTYFSWTHIVVYFLAKGNGQEHGCFVKYNHLL